MTKSLIQDNMLSIASFDKKLVIYDGKKVFLQNLVVMTCVKADFTWHREGPNLLNITGVNVERDKLQVTSVVFRSSNTKDVNVPVRIETYKVPCCG